MGWAISKKPKTMNYQAEENRVKRTAWPFIALIVGMVILTSTSFAFGIARANPDYSIQRVSHTVQVLYNGYVLINDTVEVSGQVSGSFLMGFPHKYGPQILGVFAYDADDNFTFPVSLDVPLEDHVGFYGVEIDFSQKTPQVFTVQFVLSNDLLVQDTQNSTVFTLDFPAFPSLTQPAAVCNASVVLPEGAQYLAGTVDQFIYSKENLSAFTYNASSVTFMVDSNLVQIFDITRLDREITVNEFGEISGSDSYYLTNKGPKAISLVDVVLPANVSDLNAQDQFGRRMESPASIYAQPNWYEINLTLPMDVGRNTTFTVSYDLPSEVYVEALGEANTYAVNITLFSNLGYYVDQVNVDFVLPEGARLVSYTDTPSGGLYDIGKGVFQETVTVSRQGVFSLNSFTVGIAYEYNPLWLAFRPTLWVWTIAIVVCGFAVVWQRSKAPVGIALPAAVSMIRPEFLKSFVDEYEEKMKIVFEIDSLEARVQKGRIPRRRYKVQRRTLETRLSALSRSLTEVKGRMRSAGGHYADLMRQLEVAETELSDVEANVKSIEARYGRGEVSLEAYHKLSGDYQRKKERAESAINGILLRLREEIR
jgi:hypothetical protein